MKKFLFAAAGLAAVAAATPAAAQYYPGPQQAPYGYNQPYGQAYGYNYNDQRGLIRSYLVRADRLISHVERLDSRDQISEREARRLRDAARALHGRTRSYVQNGLNNRERYDLDQRFARLEQSIRYAASNRGNRYGQYRDRDRDGQWDERRFGPWIDRNNNGVNDRFEQRRWDRDDD